MRTKAKMADDAELFIHECVNTVCILPGPYKWLGWGVFNRNKHFCNYLGIDLE